jgi:ribonuclease P protein component
MHKQALTDYRIIPYRAARFLTRRLKSVANSRRLARLTHRHHMGGMKEETPRFASGRPAASGADGLTSVSPLPIRAGERGRLFGGPFDSIFRGRRDEAHLPAEQPRAQAPAWIPRPHRDRRRPQDPGRPPRPRPQVAVGLNADRPTDQGSDLPQAASRPVAGIRRRADFLAANRGRRVPTPGFVLLVRARDDGDNAMRIGFTVSRKVGGAVIRNRMKRRLRALARELLPQGGVSGADHVLIGRPGGIERAFGLLRGELAKALAKAGAGR